MRDRDVGMRFIIIAGPTGPADCRRLRPAGVTCDSLQSRCRFCVHLYTGGNLSNGTVYSFYALLGRVGPFLL